MDIVYPCRPGDNEELRYSLRSLVNLKHDEVYLYGQKPLWYDGEHVRVDPGPNKHKTVRKNLRAMVTDDRLTEDVIIMNDDFFVLRPTKALGPWHNGPLSRKYEFYRVNWPKSQYTIKIRDTLAALRVSGVAEPLDYELHLPMVVNRKKLEAIFDRFPYGMWRTYYGNIYNIGGYQKRDVKVYPEGLRKATSFDYTQGSPKFLSTSDQSFPRIYDELLADRFPKPSRFER
jgi:hypothetical protein